jgi:energy-converting hydrogenase Eha subunit H
MLVVQHTGRHFIFQSSAHQAAEMQLMALIGQGSATVFQNTNTISVMLLMKIWQNATLGVICLLLWAGGLSLLRFFLYYIRVKLLLQKYCFFIHIAFN